ncbi:MAG TPA: 30S ribosomal protein S1 [Acidobacteriaceae bacterium]|jgi:small subunit ribosomal protein S1|nr:30S ribosomal protein S1 [Acidobacteriaceae bacterium]
MNNETLPEVPSAPDTEPIASAEPQESFGALLSAFEQSHKTEAAAKQLEGTVVSIDAESVFLDIGFKVEGVLPRLAFANNADAVRKGDKFPVSVKGRNEERYYVLSLTKVSQPKDWASLEAAFAEKTPIVGTVTAVVKGGLSVDVGVRAFMPASRSGVRDAAEMEKLVGQEITCRIIKLDVADEDVVVDRRAIAEEQAFAQQQSQYAALNEGDVVSGTVRSLTTFGAFVDLGSIDGLLHVSDMAWARVSRPEDVVTAGETVQVKVLKIDADTRRISLGLKQLQPEPWDTAAGKYMAGQRVTGTVTRLMDFGAFVELEPGIEGLIHVSEMSWVKRVRRPSDLLKEGDTVEAVILSVSPAEKRMSLGLKQALGDPWADAAKKYPVGGAIEGPVTRMMKFGAFVQVAEGVEGLVHISEIVADRHLHHPQDVLKTGQVVRAQVLAVDTEKRQMKLSIKQLVPTSLNEYLAEHAQGDVVSGRVVEESAGRVIVELGDGIRAACRTSEKAARGAEKGSSGQADLSSLTSMLQARWKSGAPAVSAPEALRVGQVRSFRIVKLDPEAEKIELEMA